MQSTIDHCNSFDDYDWVTEPKWPELPKSALSVEDHARIHGVTYPKQRKRAYRLDGWRTFPATLSGSYVARVESDWLGQLVGAEGYHLVTGTK